ncbi:acylphosphatase [Candidatus Caldarchaeum subterraneum]|uniref:acylphosphatase n=1 Tax=Caldiarchaeum subterraneum TaxID=311458 RepID=E6N5P1_CALS0|nr:acylphosphatase [Candidatus Caldarchaeum subterraneum]BAJ50407.1 acylphosphatase [Candidatus Caldarchaeum subterraneum]
MKAYLMKVVGRVQRVGYRRHVLELGQELELAGYVRNEKDGTVTIFAQGDEETLNRFMEALKTPPPPAKIKKNRDSRDTAQAKPQTLPNTLQQTGRRAPGRLRSHAGNILHILGGIPRLQGRIQRF